MAAEADQWIKELDEFVSQFVHHFVLVRALNRAALPACEPQTHT